MWGKGPIGSNGACSTLCWFSVTPSATHNQIRPFWCCFLGGCVCVRSRSLWVSPTNSPLRLGFSPAAAQSPQVFSIRGLRLYLPRAGALGCTVCLAPPPFLPVYLCANVGPQGLPAAAWLAPFHNLPPRWVHQTPPCWESSLPRLPISAPPTSLVEGVVISVVVGLPYSSIFCQFWLFFVFKLLLSFFWLCEEAQCIYLHHHLGRKLSLSDSI